MKRQILFSILAIAAMILAVSLPALAASVQVQDSQVAQNFGSAFSQLLGSNFALIIGIAMALFGLYEWLVAQNTAVGLGMIIFGVAIAFVPNLFEGLKSATQGLWQTLGNSTANMSQGSGGR